MQKVILTTSNKCLFPTLYTPLVELLGDLVKFYASQKQNPPKYNPIPDQKYISKVDPDRLKKLSENANKSIASKNFYDLTLFEISFGLYENINLIISDLQIFFHMLSNGTATFKQLLNIFLNKTRIFYIGILMVFISFILFILN